MTYLSAGSCAGKDAVPKCRRRATTAAAAAAVRREAAACNPSVDASEASAAPRGFQTRSWPACPHPVTPCELPQDGQRQRAAAAARARGRAARPARVRQRRRRFARGGRPARGAARLGGRRLPAAVPCRILQPHAAAAVHHRNRVQPRRRAARVHAVRPAPAPANVRGVGCGTAAAPG